IVTDISRAQLALDMNRDGSNIDRYPLIYQEGELRLFRANIDEIEKTMQTPGLASLQTENIKLIYREPRVFKKDIITRDIDLETLIGEVEQDSLESYLDVLQAFTGRVAGTSSNDDARDWCAGKFDEFGYDSVVIDSFQQTIYSSPAECQNIIAYKVGTTYPEFQVVVGAHRDAVPNSPGADDNGTGTCGVLEIARILGEIETELTIVFVLFDAEEQGLHGSWHYANRAASQGDSIVMMLNMDMIAFYQNSTEASLYAGDNRLHADLWADLAATLTGINISGINAGTSAYSDHHPFDQNGYDVVFVAERIFSNVYHTPQDSTTYLDYDYFTRMVQASLATTYYANNHFVPQPQLLFSYPEEIPDIQSPGLSYTFNVAVERLYGAVPISGSASLNYSLNGSAFSLIALSEIESDLYEVTLPARSCGSQIDIYFSVNETTAGTFYGFDEGAAFSLGVANTKTFAFFDDFETDQGWSVTGDATDGAWERGIPVGGGSRGDPPNDYDGSGYCFLTDNVAGNSDVDGGLTSLFSPTIDASVGTIKIDYARWYSNDAGDNPNADEMRVFFSNNDGGNWTAVEIVGPTAQASGGWYKQSVWLDDILAPSDQVKLRFNVSDLGSASVVEAAVDAIMVTSFSCVAGPPTITTESLPDWMINQTYSEQLYAVGGNGQLVFSDKFNDLDGTGLSLIGEGILSGIPVVSGVISFTAMVTDEAFITDEQEFSFNIELGYLCGDANNDEMVDILDIVYIINFIYKSGPAPMPIHSANVDDLEDLDILDIVFLINYKYKEGPEPFCQ
ncbi:MAG: Zn-dependent exopeptidase M28, partial [candidate division Zixibacteria bacterium]|nr:Zn-dependent exopeptidase M28 [candidate division Zixibacteria bacterium]